MAEIVYDEAKQLQQGSDITTIQTSRTQETWKMLYKHDQTDIPKTMQAVCQAVVENSGVRVRGTKEEQTKERNYQLYEGELGHQLRTKYDACTEDVFQTIPVDEKDRAYQTEKDMLYKEEKYYIHSNRNPADPKTISQAWDKMAKNTDLDKIVKNITNHLQKPPSKKEQSIANRQGITPDTKPISSNQLKSTQPIQPRQPSQQAGVRRHVGQAPSIPASRRPQ